MQPFLGSLDLDPAVEANSTTLGTVLVDLDLDEAEYHQAVSLLQIQLLLLCPQLLQAQEDLDWCLSTASGGIFRPLVYQLVK